MISLDGYIMKIMEENFWRKL